MDEEGFDREEARRELKGYLNEKMRVFISDGRVVEGTFQCTDKHRNLVLANCEEYLSVEELEASTGITPADKWKKVPPRNLNLAIIPGDHISSIHLAMDASPPASREPSPQASREASPPASPSITKNPSPLDSEDCLGSKGPSEDITTLSCVAPPCASHATPTDNTLCSESSSS